MSLDRIKLCAIAAAVAASLTGEVFGQTTGSSPGMSSPAPQTRSPSSTQSATPPSSTQSCNPAVVDPTFLVTRRGGRCSDAGQRDSERDNRCGVHRWRNFGRCAGDERCDAEPGGVSEFRVHEARRRQSRLCHARGRSPARRFRECVPASRSEWRWPAQRLGVQQRVGRVHRQRALAGC